jgi:hypothetical protein
MNVNRNRSGTSRRHFLKGLGVCVALPALESVVMPGARALAADATTSAAAGAPGLATTATGAPLRTAFVYFPTGAIPKSWWPSDDAAAGGFEFGQTLKPLESHKKVLQVLKGLEHKTAIGTAAEGGGDHARANGTFLTGVRIKKSATVLEAGQSIDQVIANRIGHLTRLPSLELSADYVRKSGACDSGYSCAYQYNISWSGPTTPVSAEFNPRRAFERLFGDGPHGQRTANLKRRQAEQRSILDFVLDDAKAMSARAGNRDKDKLDQYFTAVREIEKRVERAEHFGRAADPEAETPIGVPATYEEHVQLMFDMMLLAFQTDSTRVASFLLAHDGSNRSFADIGVSGGHHDLSHHQNTEEVIKKVEQIDVWYVKQFAKFLDRMQAVKDVDGNPLLHNCQIVYGSGNADGNRHTHTDLPILLAGNGGGRLLPGRYVKLGAKPTTNLFLSLAQRVGINDLQRFGDSTGPLSDV